MSSSFLRPLYQATIALTLCLVHNSLAETAQAQVWKLSQMLGKDADDKTVYRAKPMEARFRNQWPEEYEREFQERARAIIAAQTQLRARGTTYFESEKRFYGYLMAHVLGGKHESALKVLQGEDAQAKDWHRHTAGIDYYACFTLKHQIRKYFYFRDLMEPAYRQRMFDGAKAWTRQDPLGRPHHAFQSKTGWGPDAKNSWVDVRSTENLYLMRVTSVYLMAEETGNKETQEKYKQILLNYAKTLYRVGIGEWDSENYHGHSLGPLCNLYDFAKDAEVKLAAKACLDWFMAAGAVKYLRGGFNGPGSRDYNHSQPFGGSAPSTLWVYFGDSPTPNSHWESDEVHLITSAYRPPAAVMKLARKEFAKPVELFASKPHYSATTKFDVDSKPEFLETHYIANTYQLGSLSCGTPPGVSAVNGFKILVKDKALGARAIQAAPTADPRSVGSPLYRQGKINAQNRVAQYKNLAIWLAKDGGSPWQWVVPPSAKLINKNGVSFLNLDKTWIAIRPLGMPSLRRNETLTNQLEEGKKPAFPGHYVLSSKGEAKNFCGFVVEIGENESHGSFKKFQQSVAAGKLDTTQLEQGIIQYRASDGKALGFHWNDDSKNLGCWRNGKRHDWKKHADFLYSTSLEGPSTPIYAKWGEGKLRVEAGGEVFSNSVDAP